MATTKQACPEFPFFGANYPDARCIDGQLHDMDKCDKDGNLYVMNEDVPCPFCNGEEFVKWYAQYYGVKWVKAREIKNNLRLKHLPK